MRALLFPALLCFILFASAQVTRPINIPPSQLDVDSVVNRLHIKPTKDIDLLVDTLTSSFQTDSQKVRAFFYWITENIAYDWKKFLQANPNVVLPKGMDYDDYLDKSVKETLGKRKGVCQDYSDLFFYLCKYAKIKCKVINGMGVQRASTLMLIDKNNSNHAWNAVYFSNKWHLVDLTWASGYMDGSGNNAKFIRKRNEYYYLCPPEEFIVEHHPVNEDWQLLEKPLDMKSWVKQSKEAKKKK